MIFIWRGWGFLVLAFFVLVFWLAENPITWIYTRVTGFEFLYSAEKGIAWAIAYFVVALLMLAFVLLALRNEGRQITEEEWRAKQNKAADDITATANILEMNGSDPAGLLELAANTRAKPVPPPTKASSAFFIPMKFVPYIFAAIGVIMLVINVPVALEEVSDHLMYDTPTD